MHLRTSNFWPGVSTPPPPRSLPPCPISRPARCAWGCFSDERSSVYPEAPTLREQGEDVTSVGWYGFVAPAATPDPIVERIQSEVGQALSDTDIKQKLAVQGLDVHYLPGEGFGKFIDSESDKWRRIIREAGINKP